MGTFSSHVWVKGKAQEGTEVVRSTDKGWSEVYLLFIRKLFAEQHENKAFHRCFDPSFFSFFFSLNLSNLILFNKDFLHHKYELGRKHDFLILHYFKSTQFVYQL